MGDAERPDDERRDDEPAARPVRDFSDDRRTSSMPPAGEDPREIDDEFSRAERLEVTLRQDKTNRPRQGHEGMGTSSDRAPGTDLPEAPEPGE